MGTTDDTETSSGGDSRKARRAAARQERVAAERAAAARAARKRRLYQLGGVIGVVVVIVVVIVVATSGGGNSGIQRGRQAQSTVASVTSLLNGIPQRGVTLGDPRAPVTMTYYGDLECPICRDFTLSSMPQIIQQDVRTGRMNIQYRSLETATQDPSTFMTQQVAALSAGTQNRMWDYVELFYHEQGAEGTGYVNESYLRNLATQVPGLNLTNWQSGRNSQAFSNEVTSEGRQAVAQGVNSTPTLILRGPGGTRGVAGAASFSQIQSLLRTVSAKA